MPLFYYVSDHEKDAMQKPLDAERLLRMLGASGKLAGFRQAAYMIERVRENPKYVQLITKHLFIVKPRKSLYVEQLRGTQFANVDPDLLEVSGP